VKEVAFSFKELLLSLIPENFFKALVNFNVLAVIVATILFSLAVLSVEWRRELLLKQVIAELDASLMKLTSWIIKTAPVGVCSLIAGKIASLGGASALKPILYSLSKYVLTVLTGLSIHALITLPLLYLLFTRKNPYSLIAKVRDALITAFATASSSATLPITITVATDAGIKRQVAQFTLPLGATVNMDGTALYEAVAAVFLAQAYGIELSLPQYLVIFLTATLAAIGAAGIPEAGLITMVLVLESVGIPVEGIGIILAVDWFLDRCRTAINVLGDIIGAAIISASLEEEEK
ncbi:dicarboxylate/amino acid:cation symporter, partial [Thermovibrio sp.]